MTSSIAQDIAQDLINNFPFSYSNRYDYVRYQSLSEIDQNFEHEENIQNIMYDNINGLGYVFNMVNTISAKYNAHFNGIQLPREFYDYFQPEFYLEVYLLFYINIYYQKHKHDHKYSNTEDDNINIYLSNLVSLHFGYLIIPINDWISYVINYYNNLFGINSLQLKFLHRDYLSLIKINPNNNSSEYTRTSTYIIAQLQAIEVDIPNIDSNIYYTITNYLYLIDYYIQNNNNITI